MQTGCSRRTDSAAAHVLIAADRKIPQKTFDKTLFGAVELISTSALATIIPKHASHRLLRQQ